MCAYLVTAMHHSPGYPLTFMQLCGGFVLLLPMSL